MLMYMEKKASFASPWLADLVTFGVFLAACQLGHGLTDICMALNRRCVF